MTLSLSTFVHSFLLSLKSVEHLECHKVSNSDKGTQWRSMCVSRVFPGSFNDSSRKFHGSSSKFQESFKNVSRVLKGCFKSVSRVFQGCFQEA